LDAPVRVSAGRLRAIVRAICASVGCDDEESTAIAHHLVDANLTGHDSHGACKVPEYVACMRDGRLKLGRHAEIVRDLGALVVVDGGLGVGQVVAREAMAIGIARAKEFGVALVALRRAHHIGRIGAWAEQCAAAGCASVHFVNVIGHPPYVAPYAGRDGRLATNPFCAGLPATERPPVILDFATSKVAWGKILVARNKGEAAPEGALIDAEGRPTDDPNVIFAEPPGFLLPFGDHKGYGLAVICDLFGGALTGGGTNNAAAPLNDTAINNMLSIIIWPGALGEMAEIRREMDALAAWLKESPPRAGLGDVLLPGEPERRTRAERERLGIPIDPTTWSEILAAAESVGCVLGDLARHEMAIETAAALPSDRDRR
jgi:uncharacterized oxidoreductase